MAQDTSEDDLANLIAFVSHLDFSGRKALITLARSQSIPDIATSPILFAKTRPVLDKLVRFPPFHSLADQLVPEAHTIIRLLHSSLTTGLLIVYALGVELSDDQAIKGKEESFSKELLSTQTVRLPEAWNWRAIINPDRHRGEVIHPLFPVLSPLQRTFSKAIPSLRSSYFERIILPHYSRRGISTETSTLLLNKIRDNRVCKVWGNRRTFHRGIDRLNVTSKDVVHHMIRTGQWVHGRTEMKQRWYPSGLLPRTYFAWGGCAIAVAGYLRNFFNDLGDIYAPTHRHHRVQPDWLRSQSLSHGGFLFYDLTSFTSWFHEQTPFLRALGDRFRNTPVYLVGEDLTLSQHDLGSLIHGYTDWVNDFPEFIVNGRILGMEFENESFRHLCAGFLGVPGNLVTCTLAHGLALGSLHANESELQVPGDDVGASFTTGDNRTDHMTCASTLGVLQFDKVFHTPELCLYLKRLVLDLGDRIQLAPMLIYPLLPYLVNPQSRTYRSNRFRLPERSRVLSRAASVLVSFHRDLWKSTKGDIDSESASIILLFLRRIHAQVGLPAGSIFQGRVYGVDDPDDSIHYSDIPVKFPVDDDDFLYVNPDLYFASRFITRMTIRGMQDVEVTEGIRELQEGDRIVVRNSKGWRFLEDMGYVQVLGIPGEKIELIGEAARDAFLFASEPPLREVEVLSDLKEHQLLAVGVVKETDSVEFLGRSILKARSADPSLQSWRYRRYVDLDDPRSAGFYGRSRDWVNDGLANTRSSLSPELLDIDLDY